MATVVPSTFLGGVFCEGVFFTCFFLQPVVRSCCMLLTIISRMVNNVKQKNKTGAKNTNEEGLWLK